MVAGDRAGFPLGVDRPAGVDAFLEASAPADVAQGVAPLCRSHVVTLLELSSSCSGRLNLSGRNLLSADLSGLNLLEVDLSGADLGHADLRNADLFGADLSGADLFRADLRGAFLVQCNLDGAFLLAVRLDEHTDLADVSWGRHNQSEWERLGMLDNARALYRQLFVWHRSRGYGDLAGVFLYRDWLCRTRQMREAVAQGWSWRRPWRVGRLGRLDWWQSLGKFLILAGFEAAFGYGERPFRICLFAATVVVLFALIFFVCPGGFEGAWTLGNVSSHLMDCFYFSLVSFTTLGYGGWVEPPGLVAGDLGAVESFIGLFVTAMFLVTFTRRWTR